MHELGRAQVLMIWGSSLIQYYCLERKGMWLVSEGIVDSIFRIPLKLPINEKDFGDQTQNMPVLKTRKT